MVASIKYKVMAGSAVAGALLVLLLLWEPAPEVEIVSGGGPHDASAPKEILFFCAAGIKPPVEVAAKRYEAEYGVAVRLQYGGSGTLLNNLQAARRGDLYLAGDASFIAIAREKGLVAEAIPLARMRPVVVVAKGNPKGIRGVRDLLREDVKAALGNPGAASIGKQTRSAMEKAGLWEGLQAAVRARGVFKPTVNEVANDVKLGTVDAAVVWDATARQYPELEIVSPLTDDESFVMEVTVGVLRSSRRPTEALRFARYLAAPDRGAPEFAKRGYAVVEGDAWAERPEILFHSGGVNRTVIEETIRLFERREGCRVTRVYNGCGILVAQMKAGARPDAYFACDVSFMDEVAHLFGAPTNVSETDILIAVLPGNPQGIESLADLTAKGLKLGVANAEQSALGALTVRMLEAEGLLAGVMANVRSQTPTADMLVNQLRTGTLDAVIVYEANVALVREHLDVVRLDLTTAKATQPLAAAKVGAHRQLTGRLLEAIKSEQSRVRYAETGGFRWLLESEAP